jgi:hypothetical protein
MYKLLHSVCITLTLMNVSLNVPACSLSVCNVWNVLIVNATLVLVITCEFRHEAKHGEIRLYEYLRTVVRNLFLFNIMSYYFLWLCSPARAMTSSFTKFLDHTQRRTTDGRTPLDEWSARRRDIYLTTHTKQTNIHALCGIRTHDRSRRVAVDIRLGPRGHWNRPCLILT